MASMWFDNPSDQQVWSERKRRIRKKQSCSHNRGVANDDASMDTIISGNDAYVETTIEVCR